MTFQFALPRVVHNRDNPTLDEGIPKHYVPQGPGKSPEEFEKEIRAVAATHDGTKHAIIAGIANGTLPKSVVAAFARELVIYTHRIGTIDGVVAYAAEFYGFDQVVRLIVPMAHNFGYWERKPPLAERLIDLVTELGGDSNGLPMAEPSITLDAYLRVREAMAHGGADIALATTFPEAQWSAMAPLLASGLAKHYGVKKETADLVLGLAQLDASRSVDRIPFMTDIARSKMAQKAVIRTMREIISIFSWSFNRLAETPAADARKVA